jgi:hypothetical protein
MGLLGFCHCVSQSKWEKKTENEVKWILIIWCILISEIKYRTLNLFSGYVDTNFISRKWKKEKYCAKSYLFIKKSNVVSKKTLHENVVSAGWCPQCTAANDAVWLLMTFTAAVQLEFLISLSACWEVHIGHFIVFVLVEFDDGRKYLNVHVS